MRTILMTVVVATMAIGGLADGDDEFLVKLPPKPVRQTQKAEVKSQSKKPQPRQCIKCRGKGKVTVSTYDTCPNCEGAGVLLSKVEIGGWRNGQRQSVNKQPCSRCSRRGKVPVKKEEECSSCRGAGWLLRGLPYFRDEN